MGLSPRQAQQARPARRTLALSLALPWTLLLLLGLLGPFGLLLVYSFRQSTFLGVGSGYTVENYSTILGDGVYLKLIGRSLGIGIGVALITTALALVIAYATTFRLPSRAARVVLAVVVLTGMSSFLVRIYAWATILGTDGVVNAILLRLHLIHQPLRVLLFGYLAIAVAMCYLYLPLATLIVYSGMQNINPATLEASRDLGAGRLRTLLRVVVPQARAGLRSSLAITVILASADYITPQLVGGVRGQMIGGAIRDILLISGDIPLAAAVAVVFLSALSLSMAMLAGISRMSATLRRRGMRSAWPVPQIRLTSGRPRRLRLSCSRPFTLLLVCYLATPTVVIAVFSVNRAPTIGFPWRGTTVKWYPEILSRAGFVDALATSLKLAVLSVTLAAAIGVPAAVAIRFGQGRARAALTASVYLPLVVPGVLLGAALLTASTAQGLPAGFALTLLAHTVLVTPLVTLVVLARITSLDPRLLEASRDLGATPARGIRTVIAPLVAPSVIGAAFLAAAFSLDEILATSFTIGTDNTVPIWLFSQARKGFTPGINALGVLLLIGTIALIAGTFIASKSATGMWGRGKRGRR